MQLFGYVLYAVFIALSIVATQGYPQYFATFLGIVLMQQVQVYTYLHRLNQQITVAALPPKLRILPVAPSLIFSAETSIIGVTCIVMLQAQYWFLFCISLMFLLLLVRTRILKKQINTRLSLKP